MTAQQAMSFDSPGLTWRREEWVLGIVSHFAETPDGWRFRINVQESRCVLLVGRPGDTMRIRERGIMSLDEAKRKALEAMK